LPRAEYVADASPGGPAQGAIPPAWAAQMTRMVRMVDARSQTRQQRRFSGKYIVLSIVALCVLIFLLVYLLAGSLLDRGGGATESVEQATETEEHFREDGRLTFVGADGSPRSSIAIEIAATPESRELGMMGRRRMAQERGMLFIFEGSEERSFWMANTPLPLDIIFVDAEKRIVTIQSNTTPYSEASIPSLHPAQYVVEVNAGYCVRNGVREGDVIQWLETR
jgi:uncharacterized membrane protein (UPF0127 family)